MALSAVGAVGASARRRRRGGPRCVARWSVPRSSGSRRGGGDAPRARPRRAMPAVGEGAAATPPPTDLMRASRRAPSRGATERRTPSRPRDGACRVPTTGDVSTRHAAVPSRGGPGRPAGAGGGAASSANTMVASAALGVRPGIGRRRRPWRRLAGGAACAPRIEHRGGPGSSFAPSGTRRCAPLWPTLWRRGRAPRAPAGAARADRARRRRIGPGAHWPSSATPGDRRRAGCWRGPRRDAGSRGCADDAAPSGARRLPVPASPRPRSPPTRAITPRTTYGRHRHHSTERDDAWVPRGVRRPRHRRRKHAVTWVRPAALDPAAGELRAPSERAAVAGQSG